jgi:seryl-tRNA synthetase
MSKELTALERAFKNAEREFVRVSQKTLKSLDRESKKVARDLQRAKTRAERYKNDVMKKSEKLAKTSAASAKRQLRSQIGKLDKLLNEAMDEVEASACAVEERPGFCHESNSPEQGCQPEGEGARKESR